MSERLAKYHPTGEEKRAGDMPPGTEILIHPKGSPKRLAIINAIVETPQSGNPVVKTSAGNFGGGTAVIVLG